MEKNKILATPWIAPLFLAATFTGDYKWCSATESKLYSKD